MQNEKSYGKNYYALAITLGALAFISGLYFSKNLLNYASAFGFPVIGLFALPFFSLLFIVVVAWKKQSVCSRHLMMAALIFLLGVLPFSKSLFQDIHYNWWDDGNRYSVCAHNMIDNHTLYGGDKLVTGTHRNRYAFQAGYRYFLALEFLIFQHEDRLLQIINIFLWCIIAGTLIRALQNLAINESLFRIILIFLFGASIYATKNILMGLSEWFCVLLLLIYAICTIQKKIILSIVFLALAVFVRQNQIFCALLLFLLSIIQTNKKISGVLIFIAVLLLPLYHNLYFDHSWSFFPDYNSYALYFIPETTGNQAHDFLLMLGNTLMRYLGFDWQRNFMANFFGIIFIPCGVIMAIMMFRYLRGTHKAFFIACILFALASSFVLNWAYFPRFEFINLFFVLTGFILLWQLQLQSVNLKNYFLLLLNRNLKTTNNN